MRRRPRHLADLQDYNTYDCLSRCDSATGCSTAQTGRRPRQDQPRVLDVQGEELSDKDPVFIELMARSGPKDRLERTPEEQANAMLATGIDYYRMNASSSGGSTSTGCSIRSMSGVTPGTCSRSSRSRSSRTAFKPSPANPRRVLRLTGDWRRASLARALRHL